MKKKILCLAFVFVLIFQTGCGCGGYRSVVEISLVVSNNGSYEDFESYLLNKANMKIENHNDISGKEVFNFNAYVITPNFDNIFNNYFLYYDDFFDEASYSIQYCLDFLMSRFEFDQITKGEELPNTLPLIQYNSQIGLLNLIQNSEEINVGFLYCYNSLASLGGKYSNLCDCQKDVFNLGGTIFVEEDYEDPNLEISVQLIINTSYVNQFEFYIFWNGEDHSLCWEKYHQYISSMYRTAEENCEGFFIPYELQCEWIKKFITEDIHFYSINFTEKSDTSKFIKIK